MAKKTAAPKKRNPQDATLRNIRALQARVSTLERHLAGTLRLLAMLTYAMKEKDQ